MSVEIRAVSADEIQTFFDAMGVPFGFDSTPEAIEEFKAGANHDRLRAAFDGDQIVGTFGTHDLQLTVPGGTLATGGTTLVTVLPTHRRQGTLRELMAVHFREVHENNEPLAALWASESSIYGRFGYGPASEAAVMKLPKPFARLSQPVDIRGSMRLLELDEAIEQFTPIYDRVASRRPGMFARTERWWRHRFLGDPEHRRHGCTHHRRVLHTRDGESVGYVVYRTRTNHADGTAQASVVELIGIDPQAERALWQFIFGIDLVDTIEYWNAPLDDPLRWWLEDPRRAERKIEDALWIRPVDAVAALEGRRYSIAGSFVFRMRDELCPWNDGVFYLNTNEDGIARCQPANAEPDIDLTPFALGATYLSGHTFSDLSRAGQMTGTESALRRADAMFAWDRQPWCQELF